MVFYLTSICLLLLSIFWSLSICYLTFTLLLPVFCLTLIWVQLVGHLPNVANNRTPPDLAGLCGFSGSSTWIHPTCCREPINSLPRQSFSISKLVQASAVCRKMRRKIYPGKGMARHMMPGVLELERVGPAPPPPSPSLSTAPHAVCSPPFEMLRI